MFKILVCFSILCVKLYELRILATIDIVIFLLELCLSILEQAAIILIARLILKQFATTTNFICFIVIEVNYN